MTSWNGGEVHSASRAGRLDVVVAVDEHGGRARRAQPLAADHRVARGRLDPAVRERQPARQPPRGREHRAGVGVPADGGDGDELGQLGEVAVVVGAEVERGRGHWNALPPSIAMIWPVTQPDCSEAKKLTPLAMSAGWPILRIAIPSTSARCPSGP